VDVNVVIVNWNSGQYLGRLLRSLTSVEGEINRIIIVDNASVDGSASDLETAPTVELISLNENRGFAAAANIGIKGTASESVLLVNPDIELPPQSVSRMVACMSRNPTAAITCGPLLGQDGKPQTAFQFRTFPTVRSVLADALFLDELAQFFKRSSVAPLDPLSCLERDSSGDIEITCQPAAAYWLLRRVAWDDVGGFDEDFYPAWFEDVDFSKRILDAGWRQFLVAEAVAYHQGGIALHHLEYREFLDIYYGNLLKYWRKHHQRYRTQLTIAVRTGILLRRIFIRR
jgi:GT2 family glycosyltransferase